MTKEPVIYNIGPGAESPDVSGRNFEWVVVHYTLGDYCGDGEAVGLEDGELYMADLGHCSCYGPWNGGFERIISAEDFLNSDNVHDYTLLPETQAKVTELLKKGKSKRCKKR